MRIKNISTGFTLLEILLVVVIISIITAVGVNIINSQSIERFILSQAQKFSDDLNFVCEKAVLENQAFGIEFHAVGYQVLKYQRPEWLLVDSKVVPTINDSIVAELMIDGLSQDFSQDFDLEYEHLPHIICQSDGSYNAFELRFSSAIAENQATESKKTYYALKTQSPWQLTGAWYQP